eukprot:2850492-Rhodomonas_salina.1
MRAPENQLKLAAGSLPPDALCTLQATELHNAGTGMRYATTTLLRDGRYWCVLRYYDAATRWP